MLTDLNTMDLKCTVPMYQLPNVDRNKFLSKFQ